MIWNKMCLILCSILFLNLNVFSFSSYEIITQVSFLTLKKFIVYRVAL